MRYIQLSITAYPSSEDVTDILSFYLGNIGYESFVASETGLEAYIPQKYFSEEKLKKVLHFLAIEMNDLLKDVKVEYEFNLLEEKNWNKEWEKNYFKPLVVSDKCLVRSSFHSVDKQYDYEITIDPKMAFGTGHHQTTYLMLQEILRLDLKNRSVLDIGCGTAVLAILAAKMGARDIVAIDFDEWAYFNAKENVLLNNITDVAVRLGEVDLIQDEKYDFIFANINRNVLLQDIHHYAKAMNKGATLIMSGFYLEDVPIIKMECEKNNLSLQKTEQKDNWCAVVCLKK
jgi:ribosomal protein L11 methyltransferase